MIRFGTDGWRGIIGEDFNFTNIRVFAKVLAEFLYNRRGNATSVIIGYDGRFLSEETATLIAKILIDKNIEVILSDQVVPTPTVSWTVRERKATLGIMITASHNPSIYNGIKIKAEYGGPVIDDTFNRLIKLFKYDSKFDDKPSIIPKPRVICHDILDDYKRYLISSFDWDKICRIKDRIIIDSMGGAGRDILYNILRNKKLDVLGLRIEADTRFSDGLPEPIEKNLNLLGDNIRDNNTAIGIATDGDADRLGVMDRDGKFITLHNIIALILRYLVKERKNRGTFIKTATVCSLPSRVAERLKVPVKEVGVGFTHITKEFVYDNVVFGAEESGGLGFGCHIPDRDGIFATLMLLEILGYYDVPLENLIRDLRSEYGESHYWREDLHFFQERREGYIDKLQRLEVDKIAGNSVINRLTYKTKSILSGLKYMLSDDRWLMIRSSKTEPMFRFYAEGNSISEAKELVREGKRLLSI